jgi:hypothetical protein
MNDHATMQDLYKGTCQRCGGTAPVGNIMCGQCEDAEAVLARAVLRSFSHDD